MIPALQQAALDPTLRGRRLQVYLYLCTQLDVYQFRTIKVTAHARLLRIQRPHLSDAISHLIARGYLVTEPDGDDDRRRRYRLVYSLPEAVRNHAA